MTVDKSKKIWEQITPETWCKRVSARNGFGIPVMMRSESAVCMCSSAWLEAYFNPEGKSLDNEEWKSIKKPFESVIGATSITQWNDSPERTFDEVLAAFKQADL